MKFNFKKISAVLSSAVIMASTMGMAAAANYPAPFVSGSTANVAVVYGADAQLDQVQALNVNLNLQSKTSGSSSGSGVSVTGGDSVQLIRGSENLNLNENISSVWGTAITDTDLETLLADGKYRNSENDEYDYNQKIELASLSFTYFQDSDYNDKEPTLGFHLSSNTYIANYTLDFTSNAEADHGSDLTDFESTDITILGKEYFILDFKNSTAKITLLDSAESTILNEGESTTLTVGDETYEVSINFIGSSSVKLDVNGEITTSLSAAQTYKLTDGAYIGIKEINTQDYAGGTKQVEFSIGKGKLELTDSAVVEMNDENIEDLYAYVTLSDSGSKRSWDKLALRWQAEEEAFLTPGQELVMPGFEAIKLTMGETTMPVKEITTVDYSGDDTIELKTTIKDGDVTIPILYKTSTATGANFTGIGKDADEKLATSNTTSLTFNATSAADDGFVVSWANTKDSESYYLKATVTRDSTTYYNKTTITNKVTDQQVCKDLDDISSTTCTIGNVILTINDVNYTSGGDRLVSMSVNSGGSFHELYTAEGLKVYLPFEISSATNTSAYGEVKGLINFNETDGSMVSAGHSGDQFTLWFSEEDQYGTLAQKDFNVTLSTTGTTSRVTVSAVDGDSTAYETESSSKIWKSYVYSPLATMIDWDKTSSDQYSADIEYHGDEVYANVFVTAPDAEVSGTGSTGTGTAQVGNVIFTDAETSSWSNKNLIIVGGSCVNKAAAKALGVAEGTCGADFTDATGVGSGEYLIQSVADVYTEGKIAVVVAGYDAADTKNAVEYLTTKTVDTSAGSKYKNGIKTEITA